MDILGIFNKAFGSIDSYSKQEVIIRIQMISIASDLCNGEIKLLKQINDSTEIPMVESILGSVRDQLIDKELITRYPNKREAEPRVDNLACKYNGKLVCDALIAMGILN